MYISNTPFRSRKKTPAKIHASGCPPKPAFRGQDHSSFTPPTKLSRPVRARALAPRMYQKVAVEMPCSSDSGVVNEQVPIDPAIHFGDSTQLTEKQASQAIRDLLQSRHGRLSPLDPSVEAVEKASRGLNLGFHDHLTTKEANDIATYFARLPEDIRESILELLNGPTIDLETNHFAAIKAIHLTALNARKKKRKRAKLDRALAGSGGVPMTRAEEQDLTNTLKQRCLPEDPHGLPEKYQLLLCTGESDLAGYDGQARRIWVQAANNLSQPVAQRVAHAIRHQAVLEGFARGIYPGRDTQREWRVDPGDISDFAEVLQRAGLILFEKDPESDYYLRFTLLGLWWFGKDGKPSRVFYNGVQLRPVAPKHRSQIRKPIKLHGDEKFITSRTGQPIPWMCGGEAVFFTKRKIKSKAYGQTAERTEYRAYLGDGPMPEACKALAYPNWEPVHKPGKKRKPTKIPPASLKNEERLLSQERVVYLHEVISFWEPLDIGVPRPDVMETHLPNGQPVPKMPTLCTVEMLREEDASEGTVSPCLPGGMLDGMAENFMEGED